MKKSILAVVCTAVLAAAVIVPFSLRGAMSPKATVSQDVVAQDQESTVPESVFAPVSPEAETTGGGTGGEPEYEPGVMIVGLADGVSVEQFNERLAALDYIATDSVSEEDMAFGYALVELAPGVEVEDAVARLQVEDFVSSAEPNYVLYVQDESPEDQAYSAANLQAGSIADEPLQAQATTTYDPYAKDQWALDAINAYDAWQVSKAQDANPKITVAVLDSGMNVNHPDFKDVTIVDSKSYVDPNNEDSNDNNARVMYQSSDVTDYFGHGTHVAGIVAAATNNNKGISGMSFNARIMPVKVVKSRGGTSVWLIVKGLNYVTEKASADNVRVVNISIGSESEWSSGMPDSYKTAIDAVHEKGILVVYAAGNYANTLGKAYNSFPCDIDTSAASIGVIAVGQDGAKYTRSYFSNYNKSGQSTKRISAPGFKILSTVISGDSAITSYTADSNYGYKNGTSMAAPYVAGVAALLYAKYPSMTPDEVADRICATATDLTPSNSSSTTTVGFDLQTGYGLVNAKAALGSTQQNTGLSISAISNQTYTGSAIQPTVTVKLNGTTLKAGADYTVYYSNNVNAGTATVTVMLAGTHSNEGYRTATFKINPRSISGATVTAADQTYTGAELKPSPTVTLGTKTLALSQEYAVGYSKNVNAGTKTAVVTVTGKGNYTGTASGTFSINKASLSSVSVSPTSMSYTGSALKPTVTVYGYKNGKANQPLVEGIDYDKQYSNNVNAGTNTAKVTATGKGNYTGTKTTSFSIVKAPTWSGATRVPVGAKAAYSVSNGSVAIKSGSAYATLSGTTLTGKAAGTVVLSLRDASGAERATKTVTVYALDGTWELRSAMNQNMVLDINGANAANGANMIIWPRNGGANQRFRFASAGTYSGTAYYALEMAHSGKCVDVDGASRDRGHIVIQWPANSGANQQWSLSVDASNYVTLKSRNSGMVVDVDGARAVNGRQVIQWPANSGANQKWALVRHSDSSALAEGGYRLRAAGSTGYVADVAGASGSAGANVGLWAANGQGNQRFQAIDCGSGYVRLSAYHSSQVLDVSGGTARVGANVLQWPWKGSANQKWKPVRNTDGTYSFLSAAGTGYALTWSGSARSGANLQLAAWTGAANQKFSMQAY